ncbi:MAG: hypothetical protein H6659_00460 [Ardenticatenaceae bacterium]|nr:hypothetical protein [Ardenticatenaceae bacterium]MCB8987066.1 hypothetical protein [Ardenticatenaceae bacterium]
MKPDASTGKVSQLLRVILAAFLAVAFSLVFWTVLRAPDILARDDNPRLVESELRIQRGRILDRDGRLLAQSARTDGIFGRRYPLPAASPVVGYYSLRYGTAGIEESYDSYLRGENGFWQAQARDLLHRTQMGHDLRLTLDTQLQTQADALLGDRRGALLLLQLGDEAGSDATQILALASHPGYDPNLLDEKFDQLSSAEEAPLLNRVTQGQYQPGLALQPFILAGALDEGSIALDEPVDHANRPVIVNGVATYCASSPPAAATWADVLAHRCPGPMQDLADRVDAAELSTIFAEFGLTEQPRLPLNTETAVSTPISSTALALIGQDTLVVTPLQVGAAWAALAANGRLPNLQLVAATQTENGAWIDEQPPANQTETAVPADIANSIRQVLPAQEGITAFSTLVLSGPDGGTNGWYLGLTPESDPRYAVVVVLENNPNLQEVEKIGQEMLTAVKFQ